MLYKMFDLYLEIQLKYECNYIFLKEYRTDNVVMPQICITTTDDEILNELKIDSEHSLEYHERVVVFRKIADAIIDFNGFFVHSSVVSLDNCGYMFTGKSGAGKTTHSKLWTAYFGERAKIINDDKPIIRIFDDKLIAYGNPWCGSVGMSLNEKVDLDSVCFIKQAVENKIRKLSNKESFSFLLNQVVIPKDAKNKLKLFDMLDIFISKLSFYELECDVSTDAVILAYNTLKR